MKAGEAGAAVKKDSLNRVRRVKDRIAIRSVLISVWNKTGLDILIPALSEWCPGVTIYSTGGTFETVSSLLGRNSAVSLVQISDYTGQPEMQGGLVKTLDFKIYLGLLSETGNSAHDDDLNRTGAVPIDMVVCNVYPFGEVASRPGTDIEDARAHIDIGGPCMLRAAAKNYIRVLPVNDPKAYPEIVQELRDCKGTISLSTRIRNARKVFRCTAEYDATIGSYLSDCVDERIRAAYDTYGS